MELPGEKLIIMLWETISEKGIGSLLKPWQLKREGMAQLELRRAELLALAQTEKDAEDIRTGQKRLEDFPSELKFATAALVPLQKKQRVEPTINLTAVVETAAWQTIEDSVRRQVNVANAIIHAEEQLREDPQEPPQRKIDDDWLYRWRDYAGDVSAEEMQHLWGKLLAGELKAPGSYSLRFLDFLRNLSQSEARAIEKLSRFAIGGILWRDASSFFESEGISFSTLLEMQDLGVISGVESLGLQTTWKTTSSEKFVKALTSNGKVLIAKHNDATKQLSLNIYILTAIGRQIVGLGKFEPHIDYLTKIGEAIHAQGFDVTLGDFIKLSETMIKPFNGVPIVTQDNTRTDEPISRAVGP
jgi:hypothetical protein